MAGGKYAIGIILVLAIMAGAFYYLLDTSDYQDVTYCTTESRLVGSCLDTLRPVCGHYDPDKIQFLASPCAETFPNQCEACRNGNVLYIIDLECPSPES